MTLTQEINTRALCVVRLGKPCPACGEVVTDVERHVSDCGDLRDAMIDEIDSQRRDGLGG